MPFITSSGGGGSGMAKLFSSTLGNAAASIDTGANGVPQGYSALQIQLSLRSARTPNVEDNMALLFNGDNGANYWTESAIFNAATATVAETLANTSVYGEMPAAGATANLFATMVIDIIGYASTTKIKQATIVETYAKALSTTNLLTEQHGNFWNSTAAINQISVAAGNGNLVAGSSMTIYGIP